MKRTNLKKIMVIGSGPIVIGQAAEFDFSGAQACRSLREEGYKTVLVNSNPATIQTDVDTADIVYIEPLNTETVARITEKEKVNRILSGHGWSNSAQYLLRTSRERYLGPLRHQTTRNTATRYRSFRG